MRRFELVEGSSSKFWEIELGDTSFDVRWGRIGTSGQSQTKSFPTAAKAQAEHDKLVKEKTGKGYAEVGASATSTSASKPAKTSETKPTTTKSAEVPETDSSEASESKSRTAAPAAEAPTAASTPSPRVGVVLADPRTWPTELRALVQPRHAWAEPAPVLDREAIWKKVRERAAKSKATADPKGVGLAEGRARAAEPDAPRTTAPLPTEIGLATVLCASPSVWSELAWALHGMELAIDHWIATGGVAHAIATYAGLSRTPMQWLVHVDHAAVRRLSLFVAPLPDAEREALYALPALQGDDVATLRMRLFPERGEADAYTPGTYTHSGTVLESVTRVDSIGRLTQGRSVWSWRVGQSGPRPLAYTWVACFGEGALPVLAGAFELEGDTHAFREIAEVIAFIGTHDAFTALASRASERHVLPALREGALAHPAVALAPLVTVASQRGQAAAPCRTILSQVLRGTSPELEAAIAQLGDAGQRFVADVRAKHESVEEASEADLPRWLVSPPWLDKKKKAAAGTVTGLAPLAFEESIVWPSGVEAKWSAFEPPTWAQSQVGAPNFFWEHWGVPRELAERMAETDDPNDDAALTEHAQKKMASYFTAYGAYLRVMPTRLVRKLVLAFASARWWHEVEAFQWLATQEKLACLDALLAYTKAHLEDGLGLLRPYRSPRVAILAADALYRLKKKPPAAKLWLLAHPEAAAVGLIPIAIGAPNKQRDAAEHGLRVLASEGHEAIVMEVAARYGEPAKQATRAVLDFDALDLFPSKIPALPELANASALPRLVLRESGKALPVTSMQHVLTMLAISKPGEPYAGVTRVKELTTVASQSELSWELFSTWNVAGAPSKEGWAFTQMGVLGDDECARKITPLIRSWPGESQHQRAVNGLDVLASIGSDVALMHLHGIAQKLKFKGLQEKAREKIDQIAEARGLSADELADRLVPDLGLDDDGSLTLDFGPRQFRVVFDESLKPLVKDAEGKRLADLPKPRKDDDAEKSAAAVETWKTLKKDAKTIAQQQVIRLELAMCGRRRWSQDVFTRFLVGHPLVRHLVVRLGWGAYHPEGELLSIFRVAEDGSFASVDDEAYALPDGAEIGVVHTLETDPAQAAKLGQVFGDYELLQPFMQLGRETYALTEAEEKAGVVERWKGKKIPTGKVLGLEARGWRRGAPQDGGHISWMEKIVGDTTFSIDLDPGLAVGMLDMYPEQEIHALGAGHEHRWRRDTTKGLGAIDRIVVSELIRDVEQIFV